MKIILRDQAIEAGYDRYFTGKPCKRGHISERYVCGHACVECRKITNNNAHPLYKTWNNMINRCFNEREGSYHDYGGRGITVCDEWSDPETGFEAFCKDMGERHEGYTLDRIDCDGDYEPSNCRWADSVTQMRNRRVTKIKGEDLPKVFRLLDAGHTLNFIGKEFKCTKQNISYIKKNRAVLETGFYNAP